MRVEFVAAAAPEHDLHVIQLGVIQRFHIIIPLTSSYRRELYSSVCDIPLMTPVHLFVPCMVVPSTQ